jgi:mannose-6-phosphate isomerase
MTALYPLRLEPIYKDYLWGGRKFEDILGRPLEPDKIYAESWEVADLDAGQSRVEDGPLRGALLHQLLLSHGEDLLGRHHPRPRFPLLLKYLDAKRRLSVQVHPDDDLAAQMRLADPGKSEAWVILQADPESTIWCGFNQAVDRQRLQRAVESGDLECLLHQFKPKAGQCLYLPAGTVHALGDGLLVAEIQQNSNNTFRLFDWNRLGADGKPRPLHVQEALRAVDYSQLAVVPHEPAPTDRAFVERLVHCDKFILDRWTLLSTEAADGDGRCHILTVLEGSVGVDGDPAGRPLPLGRTVLLPATVGPVRLTPQKDLPAVLLDAYLP